METGQFQAEVGRPEDSWCPLCRSIVTEPFRLAPDRFHLRHEVYQLMRCRDCGCVWLAHPPAPEEMGIHYTDDYHRAIAAAGEGAAEKRWRRNRNLIARYKQSGSILDVGCSSGAFLSTMKSWKLYGIEMERSTAEKARAGTGAEIFVGDAMDAPFAPNSFDAITTFDVLEHVYDPVAFLSRVREWLKPGGMYFTILPNINSWEARAFGSYWYGLELPRHLFHFSPRSLRHLAASIGFNEIHVATRAESYIAESVRYLYAAAIEIAGGQTTPLSCPRPAGVLRGAIRKAFRITVIDAFARIASQAGAAGSIEAVFGKPSGSN